MSKTLSIQSEWRKIRFLVTIISSLFASSAVALGMMYLWTRGTQHAPLTLLFSTPFAASMALALAFSLAGISVLAQLWKRYEISLLFSAGVLGLCIYGTWGLDLFNGGAGFERAAHREAFGLPINVSLSLIVISFSNMIISLNLFRIPYFISMLLNFVVLLYAIISMPYFLVQFDASMVYRSLLGMTASQSIGIMGLALANLIYLISRSYIFNHRFKIIAPFITLTVCGCLILLIWGLATIKERYNLERDIIGASENIITRIKALPDDTIKDPQYFERRVLNPSSVISSYHVHVKQNETIIMDTRPETTTADQKGFARVLEFTDGGHAWYVVLMPTQSLINFYTSWVPCLILLIGGIFACLIAFMVKIMQMIQREEERNHLILHCAGEGIFGLDLEGKFTFINRAAELMLDVKAQTVIGKRLSDVLVIPKEGVVHFEETRLFKGLAEKGAINHDHEKVILKEGNTFEIEYDVRPLKDINHKLKGLVVTFKDITKRRELEKKLAKTNLELMTLSRQAGISEVSSGVLHNLGNVFNNINTSFYWFSSKLKELQCHRSQEALEFIWDEKTQEEKRQAYYHYLKKALEIEHKFLEESLDEAKKIEGLITHAKNVLHSQQNYAKKVSFHETVMIRNIIEDAIALGSFEEYVVVDEDSVWNCEVQTDQHKAIQILINLLKNALLAMTEAQVKSPRIEIYCLSVSDACQIHVKDCGPGVSDSIVDQLFSFGITSRKEGHGFGLHHSANLATELNGRLFLKETSKAGAVFVLELPMAPK